MSAKISTLANGPLKVSGDFVLEDAQGKVVPHAEEAYLCRCGQSSKKPFCDASHKKAEFLAE